MPWSLTMLKFSIVFCNTLSISMDKMGILITDFQKFFFFFLLSEEENIKPPLEMVMTASSTDLLGIFTPVSDTSLLIQWCENSWMKRILKTDNHICPQHGRWNFCPVFINNFFNNLKYTLWRACIHSMFELQI